MKKIRIISLGEIVTPNHAKGISALVELIAKNNSSTGTHIKSQVDAIIKKNNTAIEKFKQGSLAETEFDEQLIEAIYVETGVMLTLVQWNYAWASLNPVYASFREGLSAAIAFNKVNNQQLIFVSYSNPKDMRQLMNELATNNIPHQQDSNNNLCEIDGITLHLTYVLRTTKDQLLQNIFVDLQKQPLQSNSVFSIRKTFDIKYIQSVSETVYNTFVNSLNTAEAKSESTTEKFRIDTIYWNKKSVSFADLLNDANPVHTLTKVASL